MFKERPTVRTQFLIFTLFGDYILPRGGTIWTSSLLTLLGLLGVSERAARSTISRMSRKGWLSARKLGRRSQYSLTANGWMLLKQGEQRIFEPPLSNWDGQWHLVVYSLPEDKRSERHYLRQRLAWFGFGSLSPGAWISPQNRKTEVKNLCVELGVELYVELFSGTHLGLSRENDLVRNCWDIPDLEAQYSAFILLYEDEYQECLQQGGGVPALSSDVCFVRRFWLTYDFQSFPRKDPNLPLVLLPSDWVGSKARKLFENYRRLLELEANQFVNSVVEGVEELGS